MAMHLLGGLTATDPGAGMEQATRTMCGPLMQSAPVSRDPTSTYSAEWARSCVQFNDSVFAYLERSPEPSTVVLSSWLRQYLVAPSWHVLDRGRIVEAGADVAVAGLGRTARALRALGQRVVFVAPPPASGVDIGACQERRELGLWTIEPSRGCAIHVDEYRRYQNHGLEVVDRLPREALIDVVRFDDVLCDASTCRTKLGSTPLYRDAGHFSVTGSVALGEEVGLFDRVVGSAR